MGVKGMALGWVGGRGSWWGAGLGWGRGSGQGGAGQQRGACGSVRGGGAWKRQIEVVSRVGSGGGGTGIWDGAGLGGGVSI